MYVICSFCKLFRSFRFSQAEVSNVRIPTKAQNPLLFGCALRLRLICIFTAEDDVTYYAAQCHHSSYGSRVMEWYVEGSLSTIGSPPSHAPSSIAKVKRQLHHGTSHQLTTLAETQQLLLWRRHGEEAAARTVPPHAPLVSPQRKSSPPRGSVVPPLRKGGQPSRCSCWLYCSLLNMKVLQATPFVPVRPCCLFMFLLCWLFIQLQVSLLFPK